MKRTLNILFVTLFIMVIITGCSNESSSEEKEVTVNETGFPIVDEEISISMVGQKAPIQAEWKDMTSLQQYEEKTNISIEWDTPPGDGFREKLNLLFASEDYPEAFYGAGLTRDDEMKYGSQEEILIPLEDLIEEYAPNFKRILEENPDIRRSITTPDGHIFSLPTVIDVPRDLTGPKLWINKKWMDDLGFDMPETVDDLYIVMKAFKEKDPNGNGEADEIPIGSVDLDDIKYGLMGAFGYLGDNHYNVVDDEVVFVPETENYKEFLIYMNQMYEEGLLDQEVFTQDVQQLNANAHEMRVGLFMDAGAFLKVPEEDHLDYVALPPLTSSINQELMWPRNSGLVTGTFAITDKNPYPEATMRWVDYFYSDEGSIFVASGVEGEVWEWIDEDQTRWERMEDHEPKAERIPAAGTFVPHKMDKEWILKEVSPLNNNIDKEVLEKYAEHWDIAFPEAYYLSDEIDEVNSIQSDINNYIEQMQANFVVGKSSFDEWDTFIETMYDMRLERLLEIQQNSYDRWLEG